MYCPEKLKLNKFKLVSLPKNRDYMTRLGFHEMPASQFTGEEDAVDFENRKVENIHTAQEELAYKQWLEEEERKKSETK